MERKRADGYDGNDSAERMVTDERNVFAFVIAQISDNRLSL